MASNIKTLKEDNGDIVYPQTLTGAVYTSNNTALDTELAKYVTAEDIATTATSFGAITTGMIADDAITTAKIDDGAVTTAKLDPTTFYDVLYNNPSGTNSTITLSSSIAGYTRIKIFYKAYGDDFYFSREFLTSYPIDTVLDAWNPYGSSEVYCKIQKISVSGNKITFGNGNQMVFYASSNSTSNNKYIYITRVEGWKF